jgi:hypothetical protein
VFYFKHDDLAGGPVIEFSQRWENEGDWELFGSVSASVACPASAVGALSDVLAQLFASAEPEMRAFRDSQFASRSVLSQWWALIERHTPQLTRIIGDDEHLQRAAATMLRAMPSILASPNTVLPEDVLRSARAILEQLHTSGGRRARLDASIALAALDHLHGKTRDGAVKLLSSVGPSRNPKPLKDVTELLRSDVPVPASLSEPRG